MSVNIRVWVDEPPREVRVVGHVYYCDCGCGRRLALHRLREARDLHRDRGYVILEVSPPLLALVEGAEAVLDARQIWWCAEHEMPALDHVVCPHGSRTAHRGWDCDMRPGVWVPVKGEE